MIDYTGAVIVANRPGMAGTVPELCTADYNQVLKLDQNNRQAKTELEKLQQVTICERLSELCIHDSFT